MALVDLKSKSFEDLLECDIEELNLSVRSTNCLTHSNRAGTWSATDQSYASWEKLYIIGELIKHTEKDLYEIINMGRTSVMEIQSALAELGLSLGMTEEQISEKKQEQKYPLIEIDNAFANLVEKHRLVNEASDKIIEAHALYHKALIEESIAERELKIARRAAKEYELAHD